jgi:serine/threonine protein kinase
LGKSLGPYRLVERIGEGGFGAVYRAEQDRPVRRTVALKILKRGMDSDQVIARFEAERQALAMMEHPNVARVFDAGQTDDASGARPYFVMELVSGKPITEYCNDHALNCRQRLELFISVCHAVQHAHQKGIIHRDLKPSNMMVTEVDGMAVPKIIDFGIAKAIATPIAGPAAIVTQKLELLGTPQYMSPEQIDDAGKAIDTRSDIYSLGVVLYELLTGATPLVMPDQQEISYTRVQSMIRECIVERPSTRVLKDGHASASLRMSADTAAISKRLRGDLDWILLKALESDRDRRYASASALSEDIQRHLENQPVLAGPPSSWYRIGKFARRHRVAVTAAALVALAVLGGVTATGLAMLRAQDAADEAMSINSFMREVLSSPNPDRQGADVKLVTVLDEASRRATTQFANHPNLEAEVRELLGLVYAKLWRMDSAIAEHQRAIDLRRMTLGPDDRKTVTGEITLARTISSVRRANEMEPMLTELLPRVRRIFGARSVQAAVVESLAGRVHLYRGRIEQANQALQATYAWVSAEFEATSEVNSLVLQSVIDAMLAQLPQLDYDSPEGVAVLRKAYELLMQLRDIEASRSGANSLATLNAEARLASIALDLRYIDETIARCQSILDRSAGMISECHSVRTDTMLSMANAKRMHGEVDQAADWIMKRLDCLRATVSENAIALLGSLSDALPYLEYSRRWEEGEAIARQLQIRFAKFDKSLGPMVFGPDIYLARFLTLQNRMEEARPIFERWLKDEQSLDVSHNRARLHLFYGGYLIKLRRFEEAEGHLTHATKLMEDHRSTWRQHPDDIYLEFISLYEAWNKPEKAEEYGRLRGEVIIPAKSHGT